MKPEEVIKLLERSPSTHLPGSIAQDYALFIDLQENS